MTGRLACQVKRHNNHPTRFSKTSRTQPLAPADNCAFKSKANRGELAFATASPVSKGPAASSRPWQASLLRSKFSVPPLNTSVSGIKGPGSRSGFAQFAGLPSSTPKTVTTSLWASQWARLLTLTFRRLSSPYTSAAGIRGSSCRQARKRSTRIPLEYKLRPYRAAVEATLSPAEVTHAELSRRSGPPDCRNRQASHEPPASRLAVTEPRLHALAPCSQRHTRAFHVHLT